MKSKNFYVTFLLVLLLFWNCEKESSEQGIVDTQHKELAISVVGYEHFKAAHSNILAKIEKLTIENTKQKNTVSENNFYINKSKVQIIQQQNFTTYTFYVTRDSMLPSIVENYSYKEYNDGAYEQYLLKYHYTVDTNGEIFFDTSILEIEFIQGESLVSKNASDCVPQFVEVIDNLVCTYQSKCWGPGAGGHEVGDNCECQQAVTTCFPPGTTRCEYEYIWVYEGCDASGTLNNPDSDDSDTSGSSSGSDGSNDETQSIPLEDPTPIWQPIVDCINFGQLGQNDDTTIDSAIFEQLSLTVREYSAMQNFLQNNNCDENAQQTIIDFLEVHQDSPEISYEFYEEILIFEQDYRLQMSEEELSIFDSLSKKTQIKYLWSGYNAINKADELFPLPCERYNGKGDALRHTLWNALSTNRIGAALTYQLTTAHENQSFDYYHEYKEKEMDLFNNNIGINLGQLDMSVIEQEVVNALNNGSLKYLNNLNSNCRATNASQLIPTNQ
ncbi:hypothetical protein C8N46_106107 [Kordia periserrulae]|uniref:DUF6973 domain-containing protein n=1 Tax=Kordia periserrulae TaxID=701523 RepID=A0A2T6BWM2_9FLAO|nr:hypothetical protein [Kordia periserrulae]PTX60463.1 hypothetical protein C8N46_106107 [Kordia periserrulae]